MRFAALSSLVLTVCLLGGCTSPYINIPAQPSDVAAHDPNYNTVQRVEVAAMTAVLKQRAEAGSFTLKLPDGTLPSTYKWVLSQLPTGGNAWTKDGGFTPVYEVAAVYVRAGTAQVDVVRPIPGNAASAGQLVSVYLDFTIEGWYAKRTRVWDIPVPDALKIAAPTD